MFGIGGFELFLILLFGFLIFGPDKLPQLAKTIGMAVQKFRSAQDEMNKVVKTEIYDPASDKPVKNPLDAIDKDNKQKVEKKESFAARKAKYDKEREDKKKREAANEAAKEVRAAAAAEKQEAAEKAAAAGAAVVAAKTPSQVHEDVMSARKEATAKVAAEQEAKKAADKDLADEIFGAKPAVKKAARTQDASDAASGASANDAAQTSDSVKKEDN
ncbi:twin-arginine translocase TatA/TatE family subunit [Slackia piriformis]|uniref:twin-arginine translocase TatA/TatE family subunit n=1 Tax=Slackia TaxID=84108 RepID=UPI00280498EC|nr:twin-arginine translocase TatA/TatE family subunit [Slackia piriformis]